MQNFNENLDVMSNTYYRDKDDESCGFIFNPFWTVALVTDGEAEICVGDGMERIFKGHCFAIAPYVPHRCCFNSYPFSIKQLRFSEAAFNNSTFFSLR